MAKEAFVSVCTVPGEVILAHMESPFGDIVRKLAMLPVSTAALLEISTRDSASRYKSVQIIKLQIKESKDITLIKETTSQHKKSIKHQ